MKRRRWRWYGGEGEEEVRRRRRWGSSSGSQRIPSQLLWMLWWAQKGSKTDVNLLLMDCNSKKNPLQPTVYLYLLSYIMSSFCSSTPPRTPHYMQSHISLGSLLWEFLRLPCFSWPWRSWGGMVRHFVEFPLTEICLLFSPCDETAGLGLGEEDHKGPASCLSCIRSALCRAPCCQRSKSCLTSSKTLKKDTLQVCLQTAS